ncbi:MAG: hypothetical protein AABX28_01670 [Nanoarchaeota archaeon]
MNLPRKLEIEDKQHAHHLELSNGMVRDGYLPEEILRLSKVEELKLDE